MFRRHLAKLFYCPAKTIKERQGIWAELTVPLVDITKQHPTLRFQRPECKAFKIDGLRILCPTAQFRRQRNAMYKLAGDVQIDDAYLGGEKPGKTGRGAANKIPFVISLATRKGRPVYMQLRRVAGFTKEAIRAYAVANIVRGSRVVSDGLRCFGGLKDAGMQHLPVVTGSGRPKNPLFTWVNTGLGNIKSAITGTCRSFDTQHAERYLAAYEWRFNRRFELDKNVERLARAAMLSAPRPYRSIALVRTGAEISR